MSVAGATVTPPRRKLRIRSEARLRHGVRVTQGRARVFNTGICEATVRGEAGLGRETLAEPLTWPLGLYNSPACRSCTIFVVGSSVDLGGKSGDWKYLVVLGVRYLQWMGAQ